MSVPVSVSVYPYADRAEPFGCIATLGLDGRLLVWGWSRLESRGGDADGGLGFEWSKLDVRVLA